MSSNDQPKALELITNAVLKAGNSTGMFKGAAGAAIGILLLSLTSIVPEEFEQFSQYVCLGLFVGGVVQVLRCMFR